MLLLLLARVLCPTRSKGLTFKALSNLDWGLVVLAPVYFLYFRLDAMSTATAPSKSSQITALVAQLKSGQLTKAELFERLQRLQAGEVVVPDPGVAAASRVRGCV